MPTQHAVNISMDPVAQADDSSSDAVWERLCSSCDFVRWLGRPDAPSKQTLEATKEVFWGKITQDCPLCQQIQSLVPEETRIDSVKLDLTNITDVIAVNRMRTADTQRPYDVLEIAISLSGELKGYPCPEFGVTGMTTDYKRFGTIAQPTKFESRLLPFNPLSVDYGLIETWMNHCRSTHGPMCHMAEGISLRGFKVIDCVTGEIVPLPRKSERYIALSYVWGQPRNDQHGYPRTVSDSMAVTLRLGMRYLWVDRYCINQEDEDTKFEQISNMNLIYAHADLTIVATTGDAYHGLPGVNGLSRSLRRCIKLGALVLEEIFRPEQLILESTWATRAWTYQEGCLSRRRLFFTEQGVTFLCGAIYREESLSRSLVKESNAEYDEVPNEITWSIPIIRAGPDQTAAENIIQQYQSRNMTFESDALNACLGLLNALEVTHFCGIPIQSPDSVGYKRIALCWNNIGSDPGERDGFPSWSWTRWAGRKIFSSEFRPSSIRAAEIQLANGTWFDILNNSSLTGDLTTRSPSQRLRITGNIMQHRLDLDEYGELQLVLQSTLGRDFRLRIVLDRLGPLAKVSPSVFASLKDTTVLEAEPLGKNDNNPGDLLSASYLLLENHGNFYSRIGLTNAVRIGGLWGVVNRTLPSGVIPLVGTVVHTIDLE